MPPPLRRPRLAAGVEPRLTPAGDLYLLRDHGGEDVVIEHDGAWAAALLVLADGRRTPVEIERELAARAPGAAPSSVAEALAHLREAGVVEEADEGLRSLDARVAERFDRQLAYFATAAQHAGTGSPAEAQRRLLAAHVCVIGLGGLGSWTAWALASCGVGAMTGVDGDRVEVSNLNRQVLFREADVGVAKVVAAQRALRAFDPALRFRGVDRWLDGPQAVAEVIDGADLVIAAADRPPHRIDRWIDEACFAAGIPYLALSQQPPLVRVGPLFVRGRTGCFACQEAAYRRRYPLYDVIAGAEQPFAPAATFGPACGVAGALAASEAVHFLAGLGEPTTQGAAVLLDTRTFDVRREPVEQQGTCDVCGGSLT